MDTANAVEARLDRLESRLAVIEAKIDIGISVIKWVGSIAGILIGAILVTTVLR